MAAGYFHRGLGHTRATCELFVRRLPGPRRYLVANEVEAAIDAALDLRFDDEDLAYLQEVPGLREALTPEFLTYLKDFRFRGDIDAVTDGTLVFAGAPLMRVTADIIEAQLLETLVLSMVNHGTMVASKAARIVHAAGGRAVLEFGTRRTHPDAAIGAARAAYLVGAAGTSNVEAGRRYGIPVSGTAAHMWTMTHEDEVSSFENYVATFPAGTILLIDTYDTRRGAERAARVAGDKLRGVRLDSGDLDALSREVRAILDREGCPEAKIVASGDLDEYSIAGLLRASAPIDMFGVGTELVCSKDAPSLGGVYKVVQYERDGKVVPVGKLSEGKATFPGSHQVFRRLDGDCPIRDRLTLADAEPEEGEVPLLQPLVRAGERCAVRGSLEDRRRAAMATLAALPSGLTALESPTPKAEGYPVLVDAAVRALLDEIAERHRSA